MKKEMPACVLILNIQIGLFMPQNKIYERKTSISNTTKDMLNYFNEVFYLHISI